MLKTKSAIIIILNIRFFCLGLGLEVNNNQRSHSSNTEFILNESGGYLNANSSKKDYVAPAVSMNYNQRYNQTSGKRDYMSQFPPLSSPGTTSRIPASMSSINTPGVTRRTPSTTPGRRDYVAPNYQPMKPSDGNPTVQQTSGKVKDIVNFYNNIDNNQSSISYSSILKGSSNSNSNSMTVNTQTHSTQAQTTPKTFSTVITGSKTTQRTFTSRFSGNNMRITSTSRPGNIVLPSSIVNNNRNNNPLSNTNIPSDIEIQTLSEELLRKDINNAARYLTINFQGKTTSHSNQDMAPEPLLIVTPNVWNITTVQKLVPLLDNYERDTLVNEYVTPQERAEENAFMDAIMSTAVIRHLMNFLKEKGYVTPDPKQQRDFLKQLWFTLYSRGKGKISSSGFEHVFVSELKNGEVSGLHNWIYLSQEETANRLNYLGYINYLQFNDNKGAVARIHFIQQGVNKPVDSIFIGTSPELEIALYTLCFVTRADNDCNLKLGGNNVNIVTHTFRYRSKNLIGSAYPDF